MRARIVRIAGQPVEQVKVTPDVEWTLNRDRGLTYQAGKPDDTQLVAGEWWAPDYKGPPLLSLDASLASGYGVDVGDTLTFNILGRTVEARIANLRQEVDWSNGRLDFLFVISPGLLEAAPHTFVAAVDVPPEGETALIEAWPRPPRTSPRSRSAQRSATSRPPCARSASRSTPWPASPCWPACSCSRPVSPRSAIGTATSPSS